MKRKKKIVGDINVKAKNKKKKFFLFSSIILFLIIIIFVIFFFFFDKKVNIVEKKKPKKQEEKVKPLIIVDENSNQRPIAVMIDNNVGPSNHVGLQNAYVSYEMIVEGGLTRIMVLFKFGLCFRT